MNARCPLFSVVLSLIAAGSVLSQADKFPYKQADMPFKSIAKRRDIDKKCPATGYIKPTTAGFDAKQQQNEAKNNFSATGTPVNIVVTDFDRLEKATLKARSCWLKKKTGCHKLELTSSMIPADRTQLKDIANTAAGDKIGEGTMVVLETKLIESHYSNTKFNSYGGETGGGESVNCGGMSGFDATAIDSNDIHIVLGSPKCLAVTAEISPHFRPEQWRRFHNMSGPVNDEAQRADFKKVEMVRLTGPLFYDASHDPCTPTKRSTPMRRSIWEIHPVYAIDVKVNGQWRKFEEWVNQ